MIAEVTIRKALNMEPMPTEDALTLAAAAGRRAYADLCGDDIVPWRKAKPERQAEWVAVARGMIESLIKTTSSPLTVDELTRILAGGL